jgi:hypothetical protein
MYMCVFVSVQLVLPIPTKVSLESLGDFKIGGPVIRIVKYADDLVLPTEIETVLQGILDRLI